MNEVIRWLQSLDGQDWSSGHHRNATRHEEGVFGSIREYPYAQFAAAAFSCCFRVDSDEAPPC